MNILAQIADRTRDRIAKRRAAIPLERIRELAEGVPVSDAYPFEAAMRKDGMSVIAELKKASPSKGVICSDFPYLSIAHEYMQASCDAVSCLTEPFYFLGDDRYLLQVAAAVDVPVLRKDFFIDEYMIYEAKLFGASAILLIVSLLDDKTLTTYMEVADSLGLSALVECRDSTEVDRAVSAGARIIGVNNRNLGTFEVDMERTARLRDLVPGDTILVSESGISSGKDCARLRSIGVDAVLVGEALVRSSDKAALIRELKRGGSLDGHQDLRLATT